MTIEDKFVIEGILGCVVGALIFFVKKYFSSADERMSELELKVEELTKDNQGLRLEVIQKNSDYQTYKEMTDKDIQRINESLDSIKSDLKDQKEDHKETREHVIKISTNQDLFSSVLSQVAEDIKEIHRRLNKD